MNRILSALGALSILSGCAVAPSHPALAGAELPALLPVRDFVANRQATSGYQVSPDGRKLAWRGTSGTRPALWVKTIGGSDERAYPIQSRRHLWSGDSRYLVALADPSGDENTHVYAVAVDTPGSELANLTPWPKALVDVVRAVEGSADLVLVSNRRDAKTFDPYRLNLTDGRWQRLETNPGQVGSWGVDRTGQVRTRIVLDGDESRLEVPDPAAPGSWKDVARWGRDAHLRLLDFTHDGGAAWALSNRERDRTALVKLDLRTGAEAVEYAAAEVDVDHALLGRRTKAPLVAYSMPALPHAEVFDPALAARLAVLRDGQPAGVAVTSRDDNDEVLTVAVTTDRGTRSYLLAGGGAQPQRLGESGFSLVADALGSTRPVAFAARDGLALHGYLTLPPGVAARGLPMVLLVHGGPWARDRWGQESASRGVQQFLANRGYAVLQVNYRGSSGYGRAFMEKAIGEFAAKMHDDLLDGVRWAVDAGVADPARVAIYGASYGGYAALVGATFTPETFACAVDVVGVSDLARLMETAPPYWELGLHHWRRYVGDPARPADRQAMDAKSPVNFAHRAQRPILVMHGVNDPRVKLEQSQRMVDALQRSGKAVEFVTFQGDGHGNQKWTNNLAMYRKTEDFLAKCLGGRSSGFDYYQLAAWAF